MFQELISEEAINSALTQFPWMTNHMCPSVKMNLLYFTYKHGRDDLLQRIIFHGGGPGHHYEDVEFIKTLVEKAKMDVNVKYGRKKETLLHAACAEGHENLIVYLLSVPSIDVNIKDRYGNTCFHNLLLDYLPIHLNDTDEKKKGLYDMLLHSKNIDLECKDTYDCTYETYAEFNQYYLDEFIRVRDFNQKKDRE